ncbi:MAG: hypothetical protein RBU23_08560 [Candidatus Auribacterota bacterium]|nr:hypothetical protein [Candidatus Auribacterota bacterium]
MRFGGISVGGGVFRLIAVCLVELMLFDSCMYAADKQVNTVESCVPEKHGSIQMLHRNPDSETWVIHIQDAHCNSEAQHNIAAILEKLRRKDCLDIVLMEGAEGAVDTSPLKSYPDSKSRNAVADYLLECADISGSEYFSILSKDDIPIAGIEDGQVYTQNLQALLDVLSIKDNVEVVFNELDSEITSLEDKIYSDRLKQCIDRIKKYRDHQIDTTDYLSWIDEAVSVEESASPNCAKILNIAQRRDFIKFSLLDDETRELLNDFSVMLSRDELGELFRINLEYKIGELSTYRFYEYVVGIMEAKDIARESYPNLCAYADLLALYATVDNSAVSQEIESLENAYLDQLYSNPQERNLYLLSQRLRLLSDYYKLALSQLDSKYIFENPQYFTADSLAGLLSGVDAHVWEKVHARFSLLDSYHSTAQKFYELAMRRDKVLIDNTLDKMAQSDKKFGALITGGFHTRGIVEQLKEAGVNFAVVIPAITRRTDSDLYWSVITQRKTPLEQFIESAINSLAHSSWLTEKPLGFDSIRRQVKLSKSISLFLAESADNMYLDNPYQSPNILLAELNRLISDYDARQIELVDFKVVDGLRLYNISVNGKEMFYYFEGTESPKTSLRDTLLGDVHAILDKEIKIGEKKSVTVFKQEIMEVLAPRFRQLELGFKPAEDSQASQLLKQNRLHTAVLDYAFMTNRFNLKEMFEDITMRHGLDLDFRSDLQPVIDDMLEDGWIHGSFSSIKSSFSLAEDVRLAYYLSLMAEKDNYFPEISQLLSYYIVPFMESNVASLFVEAGMPVDAILNIIQQLERNAVSGEDRTVFTYTASNGVVYEGRIFENQNNFRYFRMIERSSVDIESLDALSQLELLEQTREEYIGSRQMVKLVNENNTVLALSQEQGKYVVSLIELGDEKHPDTILFQEILPADDQLQSKLLGIIHAVAEQFSEYVQLQGLVVIADNKAQFINMEDIREGVLNDILPDRKLADLLIEELGRMNSVIAGAEQMAPLESLTVIDDEDMTEGDITKRLSGYSANALLEVAKTTRNPAFLRVLAKNTIYSLPESRVKIGDYVTHRIKSVLIDNQFTPTDSLLDMVNDMMFFEYLLSRNPDKIKAIIDHPRAISELVEIIADRIEEKAEFIDATDVENLKKAIIESPLSDDTLLIRYFQDPSLEVRLTLAKSSISDLLADDPMEAVIVEVARNQSTTLHNLYRFAEPDQSKSVKLALASNIMIDEKIVESLLAQNDEEIKVRLANTLTGFDLTTFKDKPERLNDFILRLIVECGDAVDAAVARAQINLSTPVLEVLINQGPNVRELVAARSDLPEHIIKTLYAQNDPVIKQRLILNNKVSLPYTEYLKAIRKSKDEQNGWRTRLAISQRQQLNNQVMEELAKDTNVKVRANLALRPDLPEDIMQDLANDQTAYVRGYLAVNPQLPKDIVRKLAKDETELSQGLVAENGDVLEGLKRQEIQTLRENHETVAQRLTSNKKILDDLYLFDYFMHDYRYHEHVMNLLTKYRNEALDNYYAREFHKAYHRFKRFADSPYALYGTLFQYACSLYMISDHEGAREYFRRSADERNNVCSTIALDYIDRHGELTEPILFMPIQLQTMLQNMHHARAISETDLPAVVDFIEFIAAPVPAEYKPDYVAESATWSELLNNEAIEQVLALALYTLRDVMDKGFIGWSDSLAILKDVFRGVSDYRAIPRNWNTVRQSMWQQIVSRSNLHQNVKDEMLGNPSTEMEFFMRGGVRGVIKYRDYLDFRAGIVMDNIPSYLRDDMAKSVWTEFIDLTEDMLFSEPQYFKRLALVKQRGSYGGFDNALKISLSLAGGKYLYGEGDINKIVRSEGGHSIANGIFHNLGMNKAVDELQDRSSVLRFPKYLDEPEHSATVTGVYREHDSRLIELADVLLQTNDIADIIASLDRFRGRNLMEDFAVRNSLAALRDNIDDHMSKRLIGESLYYLYRDEPNLDVIDDRLPSLIVQIKKMKDEIASFPWDVRIFFDGGCYVNTYKQPFPVIAPPLDVVVGTQAVDKLARSTEDEHYTGEWLHYLLRLRIRDLVQQNKIDPSNIHRFFRTAVMYLSHVVQQGELFGRLETVLNGFSSEYSAPAMMRLFYLLNDPQLRTVNSDMRNDLNALHKLAIDAVQIDRGNLLNALHRNIVKEYIDRNHELYPMVVRSTIQIQERLNSGKLNAAIFSTINLIGELYKSEDPSFKNYALRLENTFLPITDENAVRLAGSINSFITKFDGARKTSARSLKELVGFIQNMEADDVFEAIEQRQVQASEPEKVVLKEVGRQLTSNLFMSGDVGFSQFVGMLTHFYTKDYQRLKGSSGSFKMQEYMHGYSHFWKNILGHMVPLMTKFGLAGAIDTLEARMKHVAQAGDQTINTGTHGTKMYGIAPLPLLAHVAGIPMLDMLLAGGIVIGVGLSLFAVVKLAGYIWDRFKPVQVKSPQDGLPEIQPQQADIATDQPLIPVIDRMAEPVKKSVIFDYDTFLKNWDPLWALSYTLSQAKDDIGTVYIFSQTQHRDEIFVRLKAFGIDTAAVEVISAEDMKAAGDYFDLIYFLGRNYRLMPADTIVVAPEKSRLRDTLQQQGAIVFDLPLQFDIGVNMGVFTSLFDFINSGNLPRQLRISDIPQTSRHYAWFLQQTVSGQAVTLGDLIEWGEAMNTPVALNDLSGISFAVSASQSNREAVVPSPRLNIIMPSRALESSL